MHLLHPVAQGVHDELEHVGLAHVQRVARAGRVEVVERVLGREPVVRLVVEALERQGRAEVVAFRGVVVDDVEDHLDARAVQRADHVLALGDRRADRAPRRVLVVRREEADRVVAPVVPQPALEQRAVVDELVDREELDRGDAEPLQVLDRGVVREPEVRAAQGRRDVRMARGEAAHVDLVEHGVRPRDAQPPVVAPVEPRIVDHAAQHRRCAVGVVAFGGRVVAVAEDRLAPLERARDRARIRIEEELVRVAAQPARGIPRAVHAVPVVLSGADGGKIGRPDVAGVAHQLDPLLAPGREEAELDPVGDLREHGEVGAMPVEGRTERIVAARRGLSHEDLVREQGSGRRRARSPRTISATSPGGASDERAPAHGGTLVRYLGAPSGVRVGHDRGAVAEARRVVDAIFPAPRQWWKYASANGARRAVPAASKQRTFVRRSVPTLYQESTLQ